MQEINIYTGNRIDIGHYTKNMEESNVCRVFIYEKKEYEYIQHSDEYLFKDTNGLLIEAGSYFKYDKKELRKVDIDTNEVLDTIMTYEELESKYKPNLPLWETRLQNIKNKPDVYIKNWEIGKRELKRKRPKFFKLNGKNFKTGILWKKPRVGGYHGRPKDRDNNFVDKFRIIDKYGNIIVEDGNWGAIISKAHHTVKENPYEFFNNDHRITIQCHTKKTDRWWKIVEFDTMKNYWYRDTDEEQQITKY